jgi:hypothetical protein
MSTTTTIEKELERERMRLAACTTAALGNTPERVAERLTPDSPYWSASYSDVCAAVDRDMALRAACQAVLGHLDVSTEEVDAVAILQAALGQGR